MQGRVEAVATKRAEVVTHDEQVGEQFREYLEELNYDVEVRQEVGPATVRLPLDIIIYHVSPDAAKAERRSKARPVSNTADDSPRFWLDAVHQLTERAPETPILVAVPAGDDAADKALDSGATDVIDDTVTAKIFRRRLEMLEAYSRTLRRTSPAARSAALRKRARTRQGRSGVLDVPLPELRNRVSGRIDARRVADYLGVPLRQLADALQLPYARVHKTPDAARLQDAVAPIIRILELADAALGSDEAVRMWLNRPLHELENDSPLDVILAGEGGAVETLLQNARAGIPG